VLGPAPWRTLSKEQLFQAVWRNIIVTEDVLKRCIAELRRAFDDDARNPHIIETISKRGYRLAVSRVAARVREGGHDVPKHDVIRRFSRSWEDFHRVYRLLADRWAVYDNSGDAPRLLERSP